jgi:dynein heavy chain
LYTQERRGTIIKFQQANLHFSDYESEMERYEKLEADIMELPSSQYLNAAIQLSTEPLKFALAVEAKAWKTAYGRGLNDRYRTSMEATVQFVTDYSKKLARPIKVRITPPTYAAHHRLKTFRTWRMYAAQCKHLMPSELLK